MRALAPFSYWVALLYYKWAAHPVLGRVDATHPDAAKVGQKIVHYETLLDIRGRKLREVIRL